MAFNTNRLPDEIISKILAPLLVYPDKICKSWLRLSTPVDTFTVIIILRTIAQAEALQAALTTNKGLGVFIKKLRVEGGFGNAMHTILNVLQI
ncbi:hypothetical protein B0H14DRAFT_3497791 [Mycena olivaceomarginata]|nr:hypothetical protein B0H14DRAFT_3497791 [Mycena olivaceomarginata]